MDEYSLDILNTGLINYIPPYIEVDYYETIKYKDYCIKALLIKIEWKDKNISYLKSTNLGLTNQINSLNNLINEYEDKLHNIKISQLVKGEKYSSNILDYESEIQELKKEKDKLFMDLNLKIQSLLKIVEEKEMVIQNLYNLVNQTYIK